MTDEQLATLIKACRKQDRASQRELYRHFYNYGMTVCMRYAGTREEAKEILNDAFVKVFLKIDRYSPELSFKGWLNKILVNTAIDHFRKYQNVPQTVDLVHAQHYELEAEAIQNLSVEAILDLVKKLPPAYRVVFNLHAVEGFSHPEIAEKLGISVGASKSNLAKARLRLKSMMRHSWGNVGG
ncbi:MAG: RNA polymerase sigma factor [Bacteroidetes bacterium]|nr:MAG: RNA polymerase sigma factor [Bacteroidota bacterium]